MFCPKTAKSRLSVTNLISITSVICPKSWHIETRKGEKVNRAYSERTDGRTDGRHLVVILKKTFFLNHLFFNYLQSIECPAWASN